MCVRWRSHVDLVTSALHNSRYPLLFFFQHPPSTEIYILSLHDALPISSRRMICSRRWSIRPWIGSRPRYSQMAPPKTKIDRKSTRLNSSHVSTSYAVFCLKKKKWLLIQHLVVDQIEHHLIHLDLQGYDL